jgi:VanZ like family
VHESSFREGFECGGRAAGVLTRGSPLRRLPGCRQWHRGGEASPLTAAGPSRIRTGFPHRPPSCRWAASLSWPALGTRTLTAWLPVVAWAALIFGLSSIPSLGSGLGTWDLVLRKLAHVVEYAVLGALLARAWGREAPAFAIGVAYAAMDELHQRFVSGRHAAPLDVAIDALGVALGILVFAKARPRLRAWAR